MKSITCCGTTAIGRRKKNQDAYAWFEAQTDKGRSAFAIVCDGMGGITKGERASAYVVREFCHWYEKDFPILLQKDNFSEELLKNWDELIAKINEELILHGKIDDAPMGTTVALLLLYDDNYYIAHVGDTRVYVIKDSAECLTKDHSKVMRYYEQGKISLEELEYHPERNVLLRCIGDDDDAGPDFTKGKCQDQTLFLICSDGFRHNVTQDELAQTLYPQKYTTDAEIKHQLEEILDVVYERGERDNATAVAMRIVL